MSFILDSDMSGITTQPLDNTGAHAADGNIYEHQHPNSSSTVRTDAELMGDIPAESQQLHLQPNSEFTKSDTLDAPIIDTPNRSETPRRRRSEASADPEAARRELPSKPDSVTGSSSSNLESSPHPHVLCPGGHPDVLRPMPSQPAANFAVAGAQKAYSLTPIPPSMHHAPKHQTRATTDTSTIEHTSGHPQHSNGNVLRLKAIGTSTEEHTGQLDNTQSEKRLDDNAGSTEPSTTTLDDQLRSRRHHSTKSGVVVDNSELEHHKHDLTLRKPTRSSSKKSKWWQITPKRDTDSEKVRKTAPIQPDNLDERIQEFLSTYKVKKQPGLSWISTLFTWVSGQLGEAERNAKQKHKEINSLNEEKLNLRHALNQANESLNRQLSIVTQLEQKLVPLKRKCSTLTRDNNDNMEKLHDARRENSRLQQEKAAFQNEVEQLGRKVYQLKQDNQAELERYRTNSNTMQATFEAELRRLDGEKREDRERLELQIKDLLSEQEKEMRRTESRYQSQIDDLNSSFEARIESTTRKMKHTISNQKQQIASIASLNTANYNPISDQEFSISFKKISQQMANVISLVSRPHGVTIDISLDPTNFLGRKAQRNNRNWPKYVSSICWDVIIRGFFHHQPGFGAFGTNSDGSAFLLRLRELLSSPDPDGMFY